jgi:hypothetical protein
MLNQRAIAARTDYVIYPVSKILTDLTWSGVRSFTLASKEVKTLSMNTASLRPVTLVNSFKVISKSLSDLKVIMIKRSQNHQMPVLSHQFVWQLTVPRPNPISVEQSETHMRRGARSRATITFRPKISANKVLDQPNTGLTWFRIFTILTDLTWSGVRSFTVASK